MFLLSWSVILVWLLLGVIAQIYFSWLWVSVPINPLRHEALIGIAMASLYALPAVVALAIMRWRYWQDSPIHLKRSASALLALIAVLFVAALAML